MSRYNLIGSLDAGFEGDGIVITDFSGDTDRGQAVAIQSDGKIVVAGYAGVDIAVARYDSDGSLDTSFDGDGKVPTDFNGSSDDSRAIVIQN